jgi:Mrp family chromosome partitioning ATPase
MKPLRFDLTPFAAAVAERPAPPEPPSAPHKPESGVAFPVHLCSGRGRLPTLAQEQIHALATHVLARHTEQGLRTLAITSALAGEGKTTVTLALAERLATANKRILVIDLDTHRASLSRAAHLQDRKGALESSAGTNGSAIFACYPTDKPGVSIMPCGNAGDGAGSPLVSPDRILSLSRRALDDFDIVLLDCPPLLPVADTHVVGEVADSAILVVRAGSTPRELLDQALTEFGKERIFAAVLNRAQPGDIPYFREVYGYYERRSPRA